MMFFLNERVERLREAHIAAVTGDLGDPATLIQAHIAKAAMLVIAIPETVNVRKMVEIARTLNPDIEIVLRTHSENESDMLRMDGVGTVFYGEEELAKGMTRHVLERFAPGGEAPAGKHA